MKFIKTLLGACVLASLGTTAHAKDFANFDCQAGDINYAVSMTQMIPPYVVVDVSVGKYMDKKLNRKFALNRTKPSSTAGISYIGTDMYDGTVTFAADGSGNVSLRFPNGQSYRCIESGSKSTPVSEPATTLDPAARREQERELARTSYVKASGYSLGGKLRRLPSKDYEVLSRIRDGRPVEIIGRSSIVDEGYTWYKVRTDAGRTGYMWGGDLCYAYKRLDGLYGSCRAQGIDVPNMWMVIAVDRVKGHGKPGVDIDREEARRKALRSCGRNCEIVNEGQPRCHAYSASRKAGYYDGSAQGDTLSDVRRRARQTCESKAARKGTCKIKFASCQGY